MEQDSLKWFFGDITQALAWGEPYWPEIAIRPRHHYVHSLAHHEAYQGNPGRVCRTI